MVLQITSKNIGIGEDYFQKYYEESNQMKPDTLMKVLEENISFKVYLKILQSKWKDLGYCR